MKDGLIVYLVGGAALPEEFDVGQAAQAWGHKAQHVELVSGEQGFFTVEDAMHFLLTRGCGRLSLVVAQAQDQQTLRPLSPAVRLYG